MKILQGDTKPKAEQKHLYQLNTIIPAITSNVFSPTKIDAKYTWTLYRFVNNQWQQVKKNIKYGEKNEYLFGQGVVGIPFKIMIHSEEKNILNISETKIVAELTVVPRTAKEPVIGRVILLNKNNSDVNKAKFNESLTAQARTSNLLGKDITFYLWEEGTSEFEKYKKPKKGTVNKHGIAEVKFNLSEYASPQTWMNFFQPNSNATKKFYVSAVYEDKKATNKTPVTATNGQPQTPRTPQPTNPPPTNNQPQNQNQGSGILSVTRDIIAEGLGSIFNAVENAVSPAQVNPSPQQAKNKNTEKGECYCNRDFTPEEFEKIIHGLRDSEPRVKKDSGYILFGSDNCKLKAEDKTLEKLRTQINSTFSRYGITTCIRKLHFLAQIYHETDRLRTMLEYATNKSYKPYFGRGLMQLTWESNYKVYKSYSGVDCVNNYKIIAENFDYACDSAGWFWKQGKILTVGKRWKGPADAPAYVKIQKPDYPKVTFSYKDGDKTIKYGAVDLSLIADDDKVDLISYLVNGGTNGLQERRNYVITLKNIFQYPHICINKNKTQKKQEDNSNVTLHFVGKTAKETALSDKTKTILKEVGKASENYDIYITSTARTPYDQARIMYDNCKSDLAEQRRTYAPPGQRVIDVYVNNKSKSRETVIKLMEQKINELGPSTVSKHLANPEVLNTFDISYGNLTDKTKFWNEMKKRSELDEILKENKCYHIQIKQ